MGSDAIHINEAAGRAHSGGVTTPGPYMLTLKQRLIHRLPEAHAVIASLGYDELRFHAPVRSDDTLTLRLEWVSRRLSASKPDRGIVTVRHSLPLKHRHEFVPRGPLFCDRPSCFRWPRRWPACRDQAA